MMIPNVMIMIDERSPHRMRQRKAVDFYRTCRQVLAADRTGMMTEAGMVRRALEKEAPRYYVTEEYAQKVVHRVMRGRAEVGGSGPKCEQWREIMRKVCEMRARLGVSIEEAVWRVIESKASSYFVSEGQAYRLYLRGQRLIRASKNR